ncbi:hypothetical protein BD779DRAFT_395878 [Infundibulicybe gibba]|nr:hypothetical protein BD779DRAFT_395878 [Infundibulicybe gibba]
MQSAHEHLLLHSFPSVHHPRSTTYLIVPPYDRHHLSRHFLPSTSSIAILCMLPHCHPKLLSCILPYPHLLPTRNSLNPPQTHLKPELPPIKEFAVASPLSQSQAQQQAQQQDVLSSQEEEELARALEESLKMAGNPPSWQYGLQNNAIAGSSKNPLPLQPAATLSTSDTVTDHINTIGTMRVRPTHSWKQMRHLPVNWQQRWKKRIMLNNRLGPRDD